jgi:hypothetical protein
LRREQAERGEILGPDGSPIVTGRNIQGTEHEELFDAGLNLIGESDNHAGDVSGFAPPGDIHRVHNTADETAISIHVYGTDVSRIGSSVRRYYEQEVLLA